MNVLDCEATRERLESFHDGELPVSDQIAVADHLGWCRRCASASADLQAVSAALHATMAGRPVLDHDEAEAFGAALVNRLKAERDVAVAASLRAMFDDMHLLYAGLGAAAAATISAVILLGILRFAGHGRPDSLAAIVNVLATPQQCEPATGGPDVSGCRAWWAERFERANESTEEDAVFALESLVTHHQGYVTSLSVLRASGHDAAAGQAQAIEGLLDAVCRARLETADGNLPLSGSIVWVVARTSVRVTTPRPGDLQLPAKSRATFTARVPAAA